MNMKCNDLSLFSSLFEVNALKINVLLKIKHVTDRVEFAAKMTWNLNVKLNYHKFKPNRSSCLLIHCIIKNSKANKTQYLLQRIRQKTFSHIGSLK